MSNRLLPNATGIDAKIELLQTYLYERLYVLFGRSGLTGASFDMYGRVYRNSVLDGFAPQSFKHGVDYSSDLFYDDRLSALMYFGLNDPIEVSGEANRYDISLYLFCNVEKLKPTGNAQRMDEAVRRQILQLLQPKPFGFVVNRVYTDIDNVTSKYKGFAKNSAIVSHNHQPKMACRIDMSVVVGIDEYGGCSRPIQIQNFNDMTGYIRANIVDDPDPEVMQTLVNGTRIPLEYPAGSTLTIPHLIGRYVFPNVIVDNNNIDGMPYTPSTGTFTFDFYTPSKVLIQYNDNE